jgi:hypothetical protein
MSQISLTGIATLRSSTTTLIRLTVTGNSQLVGISVRKHSPSDPFSGKYSPSSATANLNVSQGEFDALNAAVANGASISVTVTYDDATWDSATQTYRVTGFAYSPVALRLIGSTAAIHESLVPKSGRRLANSVDVDDEEDTGTN